MHIPVVNCAQCKRRVLRFEWSVDLEKRAYEIRVECHGEREKCYLPLNPSGAIVEAVAFRTKLECV